MKSYLDLGLDFGKIDFPTQPFFDDVCRAADYAINHNAVMTWTRDDDFNMLSPIGDDVLEILVHVCESWKEVGHLIRIQLDNEDQGQLIDDSVSIFNASRRCNWKPENAVNYDKIPAIKLTDLLLHFSTDGYMVVNKSVVFLAPEPVRVTMDSVHDYIKLGDLPLSLVVANCKPLEYHADDVLATIEQRRIEGVKIIWGCINSGQRIINAYGSFRLATGFMVNGISKDDVVAICSGYNDPVRPEHITGVLPFVDSDV